MAFDYKAFALRKLAEIGPRYMPFADVGTEAVPLSRLLRLSLFQVTVGAALVLLVGTLNRVMIVELAVPATLVAGMLALPLLFAPFRALVGHKSDQHVSALGWRRVPYMWKGTMYQFGGFAIMPFALLVLSGFGEAADAPRWIGLSSAALAFLLVGAGLHIVQTAGLALATDLVREQDQPKVVGLMYVTLLLGMVAAALVYGALLENYHPGRLVQVIQGTAVFTIAVNLFALWQQEPRDRARAREMERQSYMPFAEAWAALVARPGMLRLMAMIALGTFGFGMADVLLEPYGGQALGFSVAATTRLTALFAFGTLIGFCIASRVLTGPFAATSLGRIGAAVGVPGFAAIILSSLGWGNAVFLMGVFATGLGAGLFGHATLTATIRAAPEGRIGLALGTWGAVQATSAGIGVALAGAVRDAVALWPGAAGLPAHVPYNYVFAIEIAFLALAVLVAVSGKTSRASRRDREPNPVEVS